MMIKNLQHRPPELGKIKIGKLGEERVSRSGKKFRIPHRLDHFQITMLERDSKGDLKVDEELMKKIGEKPKELEMSLLFDRIEDNLWSSYALYVGRHWLCRCDGVRAVKRDFDPDGKLIGQDEIDCPCFKDGRLDRPDGCKYNAVLGVILKEAEEIGGVHIFRTTSRYSTQDLYNSMALVLLQSGGILAMLPLKLKLQTRTVEVEGRNQVLHTVRIAYDGNRENLMQLADQIAKIRAQSQLERKDYKALTWTPEPPVPDEEEQEEEIAQEFYPDEVKKEAEDAKEEKPKKEPKAKAKPKKQEKAVPEQPPAEALKKAEGRKVSPEGEQAPAQAPPEGKNDLF